MLLLKLFHLGYRLSFPGNDQKCLLTLLTSSTKNGYKISIDDNGNAKVYLNMMLSVYQMLLSDKLKGELRHDS
jgi:hypothetical protein